MGENILSNEYNKTKTHPILQWNENKIWHKSQKPKDNIHTKIQPTHRPWHLVIHLLRGDKISGFIVV